MNRAETILVLNRMMEDLTDERQKQALQEAINQVGIAQKVEDGEVIRYSNPKMAMFNRSWLRQNYRDLRRETI